MVWIEDLFLLLWVVASVGVGVGVVVVVVEWAVVVVVVRGLVLWRWGWDVCVVDVAEVRVAVVRTPRLGRCDDCCLEPATRDLGVPLGLLWCLSIVMIWGSVLGRFDV